MECDNCMKFFLHIALPSQQIFATIPSHAWLIRALFAYNLISFQIETDLSHFVHYVNADATAKIISNSQSISRF